MNEMLNERWASHTYRDVVVANGVVHFWGLVGSEEERRELRITAGNVPGIRAVRDHLSTGDPFVDDD